MGTASLHPPTNYPKVLDRRAARQRLNKRSEFSCSSEGTFVSLGGFMSTLEEDRNEEFSNRFGRAWRDHRRRAVNCQRRDRRDQAWWLSRPSPWLWRARRIPRTPRSRLPSRMAAWSSRRTGRDHPEASLLRPGLARNEATNGKWLLAEPFSLLRALSL